MQSIYLFVYLSSLNVLVYEEVCDELPLYRYKVRCQISFSIVTNMSQKITEPSSRISYMAGDLYRWRIMAYYDLPQAFQNQFTKVSMQVFVVLLLGMLMSFLQLFYANIQQYFIRKHEHGVS